MAARDEGPGARDAWQRQRDVWRPVRRAAALVIWGLCAMGVAAGAAWASPARGSLSCGIAGTQPSAGRAFNTGGARITLNSSQGTGGTKLIGHGTGWPANAQITVDEESNGQGIPGDFGVKAVAAADGTFEAPAFGAAAATCGFDPSPGLVVQIVARTADKQVSAVAPFTYIVSPPSLTSASPGDQVAANAASVPIDGTHWGSGVLVTLWTTIQSAPSNAQDPWQPPAGARTAQVRADTQGIFTADVPLASGLRPGAWVGVSASATSSLYGEVITGLPYSLSIRPSVEPTLRLDRAQGPAGTSVTVTGDHWWPGDTVNIAYCRGAPQPTTQSIVRCSLQLSQLLGQATVDSAGHFTTQATLPSDARTGPITFEAYVTGDFSDPYTLTSPFQVVSPANTLPRAWSAVHPRLARALIALGVGTPILLCIAGAAWWLYRRRERGEGRVGLRMGQ